MREDAPPGQNGHVTPDQTSQVAITPEDRGQIINNEYDGVQQGPSHISLCTDGILKCIGQ